MDQSAIPAKAQLVLGATLVMTPWWAAAIQLTSLVAGAIAAVCGAIVGVNAVYRISRRPK